MAFDLGHGDWRLFRLDRMQGAEPVAGAFEPKTFPFGSVEEWLTTDFGRTAPPDEPTPGP